MLKNNPFSTVDVLDEPIYYEFENGVQQAVYIKNRQPLTLRSEYPDLDRLMRIERLKNCKRKQAFSSTTHKLLLTDRENGMSIRQLANKYDKSTRTIQKYLKLLPEENK